MEKWLGEDTAILIIAGRGVNEVLFAPIFIAVIINLDANG